MFFEASAKNKAFLIIIFALILAGGIFLFWSQEFLNKTEPIACTMEAKLCADGSAVGRIGPNCEFAQCPE